MYKLTQGWPQHIESGSSINPDTNQGYLEWLAVGNTPLLADPVPAIPQSVTMRQARIYLHRGGNLAAVNNAVTAAGGEAQITWEYSQEVQRSNPLVAAIGQVLGWNEAQLDTMFTEAASL